MAEQTNKFDKNCNDCVHCIKEPYQLIKCGRKTEQTFGGHTVFAFCEDERHHEIGECGEEGKFFSWDVDRQKQVNKSFVKAHCYSCDWDGYTDDLDDACYGCGEYESLKEVPPDCNRDANHAEFC